MERFNGEILYVTTNNLSHEKKIFKVKNIFNNSIKCQNCKFTYFTGCCPTSNIVGSCFNAKRRFIELKICNELKKNNLTF